jgi:hypothetical protein
VLTKFKTHFITYAVFAVLNTGKILDMRNDLNSKVASRPVVAAMLSSRIPDACNFDIYTDGMASWWCVFTPLATAIAWIDMVLCGVTAFVLHSQSKRAVGGMATNVAIDHKPKPSKDHTAIKNDSSTSV